MNTRIYSIVSLFAIAILGLTHAIPEKAIARAAASPSAASPSASSSPSAPGGSGGAPGASGGKASFYTEWKSNPGSCGKIPSDPMLCAVHPSLMPASCGKCIMIDYNGKKLKVKVTDTCPGCTPDKIDLSDEAFTKLDSKDKGILSIKWDFVPC
jgi:rare lipoprotein A (peptidoglycan hydrolase)